MITLHKGQSRVFLDIFQNLLYRYVVLVCSRGFGKSFLAGTIAVKAVFELLELHRAVPNKVVYIIAPTHDQVTDVYYPLLNYDLGMERYCTSSSRDKGRFWFPKNVELRLLSYESVERMRGKGAYLVIWDEVESCRKGIKPKTAWEGTIEPCITTRWSPARAKEYGAPSAGRAVFLGTPKGYGYLYTLFTKSETEALWGSYHFDYTASPLLDPVEIERMRHTLDPIEFASEYLATFENSGHSVFYMFKRALHVDSGICDFQDEEDVHACIDFNVGLQCTSFFALRGNRMEFIDEIKGHPDTESLAIYISERFKGHNIYAYPDPSGRSRKTSAPIGVTDFSILKSYGITVRARRKAPPIVDSVAAVNRKLQTAAGEVTMVFHPRLKETIKSIERTSWLDNNAGTAAIDKGPGVEHFSDGVRYGAEFLFPIAKNSGRVEQGFGF